MSRSGAPVSKKSPVAHGENTLKAKHIDKLPAEQRRWTDNVLHVLKLPNKGSQARLMAGAISAAENVSQKNGTDAVLANHLKNVVLEAGNPPWKDMRKAMAATDAKVHLDLLSIPPAERRLESLDKDKKGINEAFWINRQGADAKTSKSFLCKPATTKSKVEGVPNGSEVFREALVSRAAQTFARQTGIDIGMPETHVVKLDPSLLPPEARPADGKDLVCSVQEARACSGDLKQLGDADRAQLKVEQIAGMAVFDAMTLNSDRHSGNLLVDKDGNLVPIDHGAGLVNPTGDGNRRIELTMAGPHNALLKLPGAHEPMSDKMLKQLKALDAETFRDALKRDRDAIGKTHDSDDPQAAKIQAGVTDAALESARRSAQFVKMAAKNKPPLSPASIQIALGSAATRLLDPNLGDSQFRKLAQQTIERAAPLRQAVQQVCAASDTDYAGMCAQLRALGWRVPSRSAMPEPNPIVDPILILQLVKDGKKCPRNAAEKEQVLNEYRSKSLTPAEANEALLKVQQGNAQRLLKALPHELQLKAADEIQRIERRLSGDRVGEYTSFLKTWNAVAWEHHKAKLDSFVRDNKLRPRKSNKSLEEALSGSDLIEYASAVNEFVTGKIPLYPEADWQVQEERFASMQANYLIPEGNVADITVNAIDVGWYPVLVEKLDALHQRIVADEFPPRSAQ